MNLISLLLEAHRAGVALLTEGGNLKLKAIKPPPQRLLDAITASKAHIIQLLTQPTQRQDMENIIAGYEERAAIGEFCGGQNRVAAENGAMMDILSTL